MECPFCQSNQTSVSNSRPTMNNSQIWRRRKCLKCKELFTTHEIIDLSHLVVVKKNGNKEKYSRVKLYSGIYNATVSSRPTERQKLVEKITRKVEKEILDDGRTQWTIDMGKLVKFPYIHFAHKYLK